LIDSSGLGKFSVDCSGPPTVIRMRGATKPDLTWAAKPGSPSSAARSFHLMDGLAAM
jgi:hypothetical protein